MTRKATPAARDVSAARDVYVDTTNKSIVGAFIDAGMNVRDPLKVVAEKTFSRGAGLPTTIVWTVEDTKGTQIMANLNHFTNTAPPPPETT